MATDLSFVQYVCEQTGLQALTYKKMFGEYALYLDGKVVALICDNQVFLKPTAEARAMLSNVVEASPYPGAKPSLRLGDELDDRDLLKRLLETTALALPAAKPKPSPRKPKSSSV